MNLWTIISCLPSLIRLINELERLNREAKIDRKLQDDITTIHQAFVTQDAALLASVFRVPEQKNK